MLMYSCASGRTVSRFTRFLPFYFMTKHDKDILINATRAEKSTFFDALFSWNWNYIFSFIRCIYMIQTLKRRLRSALPHEIDGSPLRHLVFMLRGPKADLRSDHVDAIADSLELMTGQVGTSSPRAVVERHGAPLQYAPRGSAGGEVGRSHGARAAPGSFAAAPEWPGTTPCSLSLCSQ